MNWNEITTPEQLEEAHNASFSTDVLIYKHSTRCSISSAALSRLVRRWPVEKAPVPYFIDVIRYREVSNEVARRYNIEHESPQILLIRNGRCEFTRSHMSIDPSELAA